jgi:hypothetical protein
MIFISHSTANDSFVNRLSDELQIHGIQTWVDHRDMPAGSRWVAELEAALTGSDVMLLVLSEASTSSSYVESEWHTFFNMGRKIIPLRLDNCDVPLFLRTFHQVDFRQSERFAEAFASLLQVLPDLELTLRSTPFKESANAPKESSMTLTEQEVMCLAQEILENKAMTMRSGTIQFVLPLDEVVLQYPLSNELLIGRSQRNNQFQPDLDLNSYTHSCLISRRHATLCRQGKMLHLQDHNSSNGSFMAGVQLTANEYYPIMSHTLIYLSHHFPIFIRYQF